MSPLRLVDPDDAGAIRDIYAPIVRETSISFETDPPDAAEIRRRISATVPDHPWLVCVSDDRVVGYAYAHPHESRPAYQWSVDVSVYVHADHRRKGIARDLYAALFDLLAHQGFVTAFARIVVPNPASVAFHESMGFDLVGVTEGAGYKHGVWHDVGLWQRRLGARPDDPEPPRSLDEIRGTAAWENALSAGELT